MCLEPFPVRGHTQAQPVRLVDDRRNLLLRQLRRLRILGEDRPGAGRHELDEVGSPAHLFAHSPARFPRPVRLAVHRPEDAAAGGGRRDDPAAREDARSGHDPELDRLAEDDALVVVAPDVSHGRDPTVEERTRRLREHEPPELGGPGKLSAERRPRAEARTP